MTTIKTKPVMTMDGEYTKIPVTGPKPAMRAVLDIMFNHSADMLKMVVGIIAEKYELDEEDIMTTVLDHPSFKTMTVAPVLNDLGYFTPDPADALADSMSGLSLKTETPAAAAAAAPPIKKYKIIRKAKAPANQSS